MSVVEEITHMKKLNVEGFDVTQEFTAIAMHRIKVGERTSEWRLYTKAAVIKLDTFVFVGTTAYYGFKRERVCAIRCADEQEAQKLRDLLLECV